MIGAATRVRPAVSRSVPVAAPIGGLNTRDPIDLHQPTDAAVMENWWPSVGGVVVRDGYALHQGSVGSGNVDTVAEYNVGANRALLAASNGNIYDATSTPSSLASGFSLDRWQTAVLGTSMGWVNGTDASQLYNGSTVAAMTLTGPTSANVIGIMVHRSRSYFFEDGSQSFWYSAVNAMGGTVTEFPLGRLGNGGNLVCMSSINVEGGSDTWGGGGIGSDLACFCMSSGDIIVYEGDDPGSNFNLIGVYRAGTPVDVRGIARHGSDLFLLTTAGVVSVPRLMAAGRLDARGLVTDKIRPTIRDAVSDYRANTGWQIIVHPTESLGIINVPVSATQYDQYAVNLETGAWGGPWLDIPARCWGVYNDQLYFGSTGATVELIGAADDGGTAIAGDVQTAFSRPGGVVRCSALRPVFKGAGSVSIGLSAQFDYETSPVSLTTRSIGPVAADWDALEANWNDWGEVNWEGASGRSFSGWFSATGAGYALGARMQSSTTEALTWESITYMVESGQGIG